MKTLLLLTSLLISRFCVAQKDSIYRPSTFQEMFSQMDNALSPVTIKIIKELTEDSIRKTNPYTTNLTKAYDYYNDSKIVTDLEAKNIGYDDRYDLFAISYHRYLNKLDLQLDNEYKYYDSIRIVKQKEYEVALTRDSVDGKYIPSNLADCFIELDKILSSQDKAYIKKNGTSGLHMTLGMSIRNRWQLWGGSRLAKYFLDMNGGMMHPDSMSGLILRYYDKWLHGDKTAWREWEIKSKRRQ